MSDGLDEVDATDVLLRETALDRPGTGELAEIVYTSLKRLAAARLKGERANHTLSATDLVHEVYVRIVSGKKIDWNGKTHFFAIAASEVRRVLVEHARQKGAAKRGGGAVRVSLDDNIGRVEDAFEVVALDIALEKLEQNDERQSKVFELRFFGGMKVPEVAHTLGVAERTVKSDWHFARAWLRREMTA